MSYRIWIDDAWYCGLIDVNWPGDVRQSPVARAVGTFLCFDAHPWGSTVDASHRGIRV